MVNKSWWVRKLEYLFACLSGYNGVREYWLVFGLLGWLVRYSKSKYSPDGILSWLVGLCNRLRG